MLTEKPWRPEAVVQFWLLQAFCFCLGVTVSGLLQYFLGLEAGDSFPILIIGTVSFHGAALVLIWFFLRQHGVRFREAYGLRGPLVGRAIIMGVMLGFIVLPIAWMLQMGSGWFLEWIGWEPKEQHAVTLLRETSSWPKRAYLGVFTIGLAPLVEEFLFRGMLYPFVKSLGYPRLAFVGVSFAFAIIHLSLVSLVPLFVLALALTWLYEHTDNLLAPITVHALFNAANFVLLLRLDYIMQSPP